MSKQNPSTCMHLHAPEPLKWKCPECGATADDDEGFFIESVVDTGCEKLHNNDVCRCYACGYIGKGKEVSKRLRKAEKRVPCPHCNGTGVVAG